MTWMRPQWVTNWRVQLIYQPGAVARLLQASWPGFLLQKGEFNCLEGERGTEEAVKALLSRLRTAPRDPCRLAPNHGNQVIAVSPYIPGWVRCPGCGVRFSLDNPASWTGERHQTCGQCLHVEEAS